MKDSRHRAMRVDLGNAIANLLKEHAESQALEVKNVLNFQDGRLSVVLAKPVGGEVAFTIQVSQQKGGRG